MKRVDISIFSILQWAAVTVFIGRSYQHLFWDGPYREIFWDPFYMQWFIESFTSLGWDDYVTHPMGDVWFQRFVFFQGIFYLVCAIISVFIRHLPKWCRVFLLIGAVDLIFLALIYMKDRFYHFGQFFEYSLQFGAPLFLYAYLKNDKIPNRLVLWMKIAVALTFTCHGLYAFGYYPRPGSFMTMTQNILGLEALGIHYFLLIAGVLDFIFAAGIFIARKKVLHALLWYGVLWGALTAFARIFGNFYWDFPLESLHQWVFECVYRFPHFLIPLALILILRKKQLTTNCTD
ncbi:MAG: hypothetical protein AAFZ15_25565 [Bacteroidota bacterium]